MEIKAELLYPYTQEEKESFIINQNHRLGYEIRETETALQAWGKSQEDIIEERKEQFKKEFFNTSIGFIRRSVSMKDGSRKDFLSDLLPTISMAVTMGQPVKVIAYDEPDFTQEVIDWEEYQHNEDVTPQFIQECFMQLQADFGVVNEGV